MKHNISEYSECLKSELAWISDSSVVSHSQTVWILDSVWKPNVQSKHQKARPLKKLWPWNLKATWLFGPKTNFGFWTSKSIWNPSFLYPQSVLILVFPYFGRSDSDIHCKALPCLSINAWKQDIDLFNHCWLNCVWISGPYIIFLYSKYPKN